MSSIDPKNVRYLKNRSLWRKITPYSRQKPQNVTLLDQKTNVEYTFDKTSYQRHRDIYEIDDYGVQSSFVFPDGEYEEGLITFADEELVAATFATPFTGTPYVVLSMETSDAYSNVGFCGIYVDAIELYVLTTAPFTGQIRYRAVYAPEYPARVVSGVSGSLTVTAGKISSDGDGTSGKSLFQASVPIYQPSSLSEYRATPIFVGNFFTQPIDSNVSVVELSATQYGIYMSVSAQVSAPLSTLSSVDYLVVL